MNTPKPRTQFALQSRILHWLMAAMLLAMLFIGVSMVASLGDYHRLALMFAQPLVGWGMLSAGHYPIVMFGPVHLPPILPANPTLYAVLRQSHTVLAYLLFATFLAHLSAVLFHTLIVRDRLLDRMALWPIRSRKNKSQS